MLSVVNMQNGTKTTLVALIGDSQIKVVQGWLWKKEKGQSGRKLNVGLMAVELWSDGLALTDADVFFPE